MSVEEFERYGRAHDDPDLYDDDEGPDHDDLWLNAEMTCAVCSNEWVATYPEFARRLECPKCEHYNQLPQGASDE